MNHICTCRWCGLSEEKSALQEDANDLGFWCPDCDGYTYFDEAQDNRRMLLLLESRNSGFHTVVPNKTDLKKRMSPLRYPGGKSRVIDQIFRYLDPVRLETFVELFAGGASLGLSLLEAGKIGRLVLNDLDPLVYNFWAVVLERTDELLAMLQGPLPTMRDYCAAKERVKKSSAPKTDCVKLAYDFLLLNRLNYGGIITANPICGKGGTDEGLRQRWDPKTLSRRVKAIHRLRANIQLTHEDVRTLLLDNAGWLPASSTIFVDPPYTAAGKRLYRETFADGHKELAEILNLFFCSWPGPDIIITYDDCPLVRDLYPYASVAHLHTSWSISRKTA